MNITVVGRGNVGGGLADRWEQTGHRVTRLGRDGGDASDADAVLIAVPSDQIADALGRVDGLKGKIDLDATNAYDGRDEEWGVRRFMLREPRGTIVNVVSHHSV